MGRLIKELPKTIDGWNIVKDLGMVKVGDIAFDRDIQKKRKVLIQCPNCGKICERLYGNLISRIIRKKGHIQCKYCKSKR